MRRSVLLKKDFGLHRPMSSQRPPNQSTPFRRRHREQEATAVHQLRTRKNLPSHQTLLVELTEVLAPFRYVCRRDDRIPLFVETTLPRSRQVGESASPHRDASLDMVTRGKA